LSTDILIGEDSGYRGANIHNELISSLADRISKFEIAPQIINTTDSTAAYLSFEANRSIIITTYNGDDPLLGDGTLRVKIYHKTITFGA
jgi:hypothetical protein